jgi:phage-related baseplate assembly protein
MEAFPFDVAKEKIKLRDLWERLTGYRPRPSSPDDNILDLALYIETVLADYINKKYRAGFLSFAEGKELDLIARDVFGIERLGPVPAITTLRFYLSQQTTVPAGTKVATKDMKVVFETEESVSGSAVVDVRAVAKVRGEVGNGYLPGEVSLLLDDIPGVDRVENITVTTGGAEKEDDERFRERIRLSMERFSTAGPEGAYVFHTKSAHPSVGDVSVFSPSPGVVKVVFLLSDGSIPSQTYIDIVSAYLSEDRIRV